MTWKCEFLWAMKCHLHIFRCTPCPHYSGMTLSFSWRQYYRSISDFTRTHTHLHSSSYDQGISMYPIMTNYFPFSCCSSTASELPDACFYNVVLVSGAMRATKVINWSMYMSFYDYQHWTLHFSSLILNKVSFAAIILASWSTAKSRDKETEESILNFKTIHETGVRSHFL